MAIIQPPGGGGHPELVEMAAPSDSQSRPNCASVVKFDADVTPIWLGKSLAPTSMRATV